MLCSCLLVSWDINSVKHGSRTLNQMKFKNDWALPFSRTYNLKHRRCRIRIFAHVNDLECIVAIMNAVLCGSNSNFKITVVNPMQFLRSHLCCSKAGILFGIYGYFVKAKRYRTLCHIDCCFGVRNYSISSCCLLRHSIREIREISNFSMIWELKKPATITWMNRGVWSVWLVSPYASESGRDMFPQMSSQQFASEPTRYGSPQHLLEKELLSSACLSVMDDRFRIDLIRIGVIPRTVPCPGIFLEKNCHWEMSYAHQELTRAALSKRRNKWLFSFCWSYGVHFPWRRSLVFILIWYSWRIAGKSETVLGECWTTCPSHGKWVTNQVCWSTERHSIP
jgi:hypothetical protein